MKYLFFFVLSFFISFLAFSQPLKVGVYNNPPMSEIDAQGNVSGFFVDILKDIASKEGWQLEFHVYDFSAGLQALESGEIDLMFPLAYSKARDSIFYFNETNVSTSWGKLYKNADDETNYASIIDLPGKRIAVMLSDYYFIDKEHGLKHLIEELNIKAEIIACSSYSEVIDRVSEGQADVGLVAMHYGVKETANKGVVKTPINFAYVSLRFAFNRSPENEVLAKTLDRRLIALINDRTSVYYSSRNKIFSLESMPFIPLWVWRALGFVLFAIVILFVFVVMLQYQVKKKTDDLKKTNRMLSKSEQEARLAVQTIEASQDIGFWFQRGKNFIRVNQAAITLTGYNKNELLKMQAKDLLANDSSIKYYESLEEGNWEGHLRTEEVFRTKTGNTFPVDLSLDEFRLDGKIYICGFARDISERVKAEHELIDRNKELSCLYTISRLVAERDKNIEDILYGTLEAIPKGMQYPEITNVKIKYAGKDYLVGRKQECTWQLKTPILSSAEEVGEIVVGYCKTMPEEAQGPFLQEEVEMINTIGKAISNMLDARNTERRIISTILTTEDKERSRISKELHDSVGQTLSAISINFSALAKDESLLVDDQNKAKNIEKLIKIAIDESRSVSHNLMPQVLMDLGYTYAIENLLSSIEIACETKFSFQSNTSNIEVAKEIQLALFRITQEAINNIMKYALATEATIQYLVYEDLVSLSIEDNGIGFDLESIDKNHNFGLNSMRNRAASIGAEFIIDTTPDKGTGIHVTLQLNYRK